MPENVKGSSDRYLHPSIAAGTWTNSLAEILEENVKSRYSGIPRSELR